MNDFLTDGFYLSFYIKYERRTTYGDPCNEYKSIAVTKPSFATRSFIESNGFSAVQVNTQWKYTPNVQVQLIVDKSQLDKSAIEAYLKSLFNKNVTDFQIFYQDCKITTEGFATEQMPTAFLSSDSLRIDKDNPIFQTEEKSKTLSQLLFLKYRIFHNAIFRFF